MSHPHVRRALVRKGCTGFVLMALCSTVVSAQRPPTTPVKLFLGSVGEVNARLDSLERVALRAPSPEERFSAMLKIEAPGIAWALLGEPSREVLYPGIVARMRRLYPDADDAVRQRIVNSLFLQAESAEAVAFLGQLAQTDDMGPQFTIAEAAVRWLSMMGTEGEAELRQIHATGRINSLIRKQLEDLARTGYRNPPG